MPRVASIRAKLLRNLVAMIVILGVAILATTFIGARQAVRALSQAIVGRTLDTVEARLDGFFAEPARLLRMTCAQAAAGAFELDAPSAGTSADDEQRVNALRDHRNRLLAPVIDRYPQISSLMLNDGAGREHMLLYTGTQWRNRVSSRDDWGLEVRWLEWSGDGSEGRAYREQLDYEPRTRPWYVGALAARDRSTGPAPDMHWTEPYIFFTTQDPGITASMTYDLGDGLDRAIGFDVLLSDISTFTQQMQVGERGIAAVLTNDRRLVGLPRLARFDDPEERKAAFLKHPEELDLTLFDDAATALRASGFEQAATIRFHSGGEAWWGRVSPFALGANRQLRIAIVVPEADLLGSLRTQRLVIITIVLLVLVASVLRAVVLARRFSAPVEELVRQSERISTGDLEPGAPIATELAEIRRLAAAQDEMREGLKSVIKLQKLERDLDIARDIQRGLLPTEQLSIRGFEVFGWNQPADQTGGDYFDWQQLPDGRWAVTVADVTGHGVGPALVTAFCRAYSRASLPLVDELGACLSQLNNLVHDDIPAERFVTLVIALLDPARGELELLSAGHGPLFLFRAASGSIERFNAHDIPLGLMTGVNYGPTQRLQLAEGDVLVLLTDGFFEWANAEQEQFGIERLSAAVKASADQPAERIVALLHESVLAFVGSTPQPDDLTVVVIKRTSG